MKGRPAFFRCARCRRRVEFDDRGRLRSFTNTVVPKLSGAWKRTTNTQGSGYCVAFAWSCGDCGARGFSAHPEAVRRALAEFPELLRDPVVADAVNVKYRR